MTINLPLQLKVLTSIALMFMMGWNAYQKDIYELIFAGFIYIGSIILLVDNEENK